MSGTFRAACIQNSATPDVHADIATCLGLIDRAAEAGAEFIALPEYCVGLDTRNGLLYPTAFSETEHPALPAFSGAAATPWRLAVDRLDWGSIARWPHLQPLDHARPRRQDRR